MSIKIVQGGAQWLSICLAYIRPWVPSPVPKKKKKKVQGARHWWLILKFWLEDSLGKKFKKLHL
jgi:hypothetical protein